MSINKLNFGKAIKTLRQWKNLTQKELAKQAGISQPMVSGIENNKKIPSAQIIAQLAHALKVPEQQIYYEARRFSS